MHKLFARAPRARTQANSIVKISASYIFVFIFVVKKSKFHNSFLAESRYHETKTDKNILKAGRTHEATHKITRTSKNHCCYITLVVSAN